MKFASTDEIAALVEMEKFAKFPKGEAMTVEEVAAVVGPEFKEMNENPPESVQRVMEEMQKIARVRITDRETTDKTAGVTPAGLYGYTKAIQKVAEAATRRIQKRAVGLARIAYQKDAQVAPFLSAHAKRAESLPARILIAAMKELGPKFASQMEKEAGASEFGLYGFKHKTAELGLSSCSLLRSEVGRIAYDLHQRKADLHEQITGFLKQHSRTAKCHYSRILLASYPDLVVAKVASHGKSVAEWLALGA